MRGVWGETHNLWITVDKAKFRNRNGVNLPPA
jgi:hypothetical protein